MLALARPGAIDFTEQYSNVKESNQKTTIHPFFDELLSQTNGVALYQEQLMKMAHEIGFTLDDAELLRRIVGKKKSTKLRSGKRKSVSL